MADNPFAKWAEPSAPAEAPAGNPFAEFTTGTPDTPPTTRITVRPEQPPGVVPPEQGQGPEQPPMGAGPAFGVGAAQGVTANFGDELSGLTAAGGGMRVSPNPIAALAPPIMGLARLGWEKLTGQDQPQQPDPDQPPTKGPGTAAYEQARDKWRATVEQAQRQHPVAYTGGQVAGAVATPIRAGAMTAPMRVRAARSAAVGGTMGALAGAGEGTDAGSRATGAAIGGVTGSVVGAAATPIAEGAAQAARYASQPVRRAFNKTFRPDQEAQRSVGTHVVADIRNDPTAQNRLTAAELAANPGTRLLDLGGNSTRRLAETATIMSREGDTVVRNTLATRKRGEGDRFINWAQQTFNYPNPDQQARAIARERTAVVGPAYRQAYADGDHPVFSDELNRLLGSPHVVEAMKDAVTKGKSIAIAEGHGAFNPAVQVTQDGRVLFNKGAGGVPAYPNLQLWDYVKRSLDDQVQKLHRAGSADEARVVSSIRQQLRDELDTLVPSYANARNSATEFFGATNALEAGQNFFGSGKRFGSWEEAHAAIQGMNPLQRQLFQDGYAAAFIHKLNSIDDRASVWTKIGQNENARAELRLALSPARARELEAMTRIEELWSRGHDAVVGNSKTARRQYDVGTGVLAAGGTSLGAAGLWNQNPETIGWGAFVGSLAAGNRMADRRIAERVGRLLMSEDPQQLQAAIRLVAGNERLMDAMRRFGTNTGSRAAPQQTIGIAGPQAAGVGRAEEDRPGVPWPQQQ